MPGSGVLLKRVAKTSSQSLPNSRQNNNKDHREECEFEDNTYQYIRTLNESKAYDRHVRVLLDIFRKRGLLTKLSIVHN